MVRVAAVILVVAFLAVTMTACGGGGASGQGAGATAVPPLPGAAIGYVFVPVGGGAPYVVCTPTNQRPGDVPAVGATVSIVGLTGSSVVVGSTGRYSINNIPPGLQTLRVVYDSQAPVQLVILIVSGQSTCGSGHSEGGG